MTSAQSPSIDFNQMLVFSVFFHFFLFATVMFLPQTKKVVRHIKPAFMVSLVNIPTGPDAPPVPQAAKAPVAPQPPEKSIPEKPVPSKTLSKLDELAQLEKKKSIPKKDKLAMAVPKPKESVLEDFEKIKMKTAVEKKPTRKVIAKDDLTRKEDLEFKKMSEKSATHEPKEKPRKASSRVKDLDELKKLNRETQAALSQPKANPVDPKPNELVKQLEAIKKQKVQIKIDSSKLSSHQFQKFKSGLRNSEMTKAQKNSATPVASGESGDPAANALSLYLGKAQIQINEQWKNPAGGGSGRVQVSFKIFPNGTIERPKIKKSSGVSKLDNLALLAVKNAVLPPFPKEIREPNLPFIYEFIYEPSKK